MTGEDYGWTRHAAMLGVEIPRIWMPWGNKRLLGCRGQGSDIISTVYEKEGVGEREGKRDKPVIVQFSSA